MNTFISTILLGISLSMDAFSLSICLGLILSKKKAKFFTITVGIFHLVMPVLGALLGIKMQNIFDVNTDLVFTIIILIIIIQIIIDIIKNEETSNILNVYELIILALGVSLDSFSVGFALALTSQNVLICGLIFSIFSMFFTILGLIISKYSSEFLGKKSRILGLLILIVLLITHII